MHGYGQVTADYTISCKTVKLHSSKSRKEMRLKVEEGVTLGLICDFTSTLFFIIALTSQLIVRTMVETTDLHCILQAISPNDLFKTCCNEHLAEITKEIQVWQELTPYLSITEPEEEEIRQDNPNYHTQKLACLRKWKEKFGHKATYEKLIQAFWNAGKKLLAYKVAKILSKNAVTPFPRSTLIDEFHQYLLDTYRQESAPGTTEFPFTEHFQYIKPLLQCKGKEKGSRHAPIKMEELFVYNKTERPITLLEGPAGSGKSTLIWQVKQEWARGSLYPEIQLLIYVPLREPRYHTATDLKDLIPCPVEEMKLAVAGYVKRHLGGGVCFLWDGWDEVPYRYQRRSYIYKLLVGQLGEALPRAKILIASRSVATLIVGNVAPKHVLIAPFSKDQVYEYLKCTELSPSDIDKYLDNHKHLIRLCELPINASIVSIILCDPRRGQAPLPRTQTELLESLSTNLILRYVDMRLDCIPELEHLPDSAKRDFDSFCKLAYDGICAEKRVFFTDDLQQHGIDAAKVGDSHGLMTATPVRTSSGPSRLFTFLHLNLQEYLAAVHMKVLSVDELNMIVSETVQKHPDSQVLIFYAGITHLVDQPSFSTFLRYWQDTMHRFTSASDVKNKPENHFSLFMKCIFEAQSQKLCSTLCDSLSSSVTTAFSLKGMYLKSETMSAFAYFLAKCSFVLPLTVDLSFSTFEPGSLNAFTSQLAQEHPSNLTLELVLDGTVVTLDDIKALSKLPPMLSMLSLNESFEKDTCNILGILSTLTEAVLSSDGSVKQLSMKFNSISKEHAPLLVPFLAGVNGLKHVDLSGNPIGSGLQRAIHSGTTLQTLKLDQCDLGDEEFVCLGKAVADNTVLEELSISSNQNSPAGMTSFLSLISSKSFNTKLHKLTYDYDLSEDQQIMIQKFNNRRCQNGLKNLIVSQKS